jgi:hypothetical protein
MPRKPQSKPTKAAEAEEYKRFVATAKKLGADKDAGATERFLTKIAAKSHKP